MKLYTLIGPDNIELTPMNLYPHEQAVGIKCNLGSLYIRQAEASSIPCILNYMLQGEP